MQKTYLDQQDWGGNINQEANGSFVNCSVCVVKKDRRKLIVAAKETKADITPSQGPVSQLRIAWAIELDATIEGI